MSKLEEKCRVILIGDMLPFSEGDTHLYICSNAEIKEGDWYYRPDTKTIHLDSNDGHGICECLKIISSTDKSLGLPPLSREFIEEYITMYNAGTPIRECKIEMEKGAVKITDCKFCNGTGIQDLGDSMITKCKHCYSPLTLMQREKSKYNSIIPKVKNGEIFIRRVEETWDSIWLKWRDSWDVHHQNYEIWLEDHYNVPTKK